MGTALLARGLPADALPEEWILARPDEISAVHAGHAAAGAQVVLTATFNLAAPRLAERLTPGAIARAGTRAVDLARAAAPGARIAGAVGPTALCGPGLTSPSPEALRAAFGAAFRTLAAAGADLLWIESMWDLGEARAALRAARETGLATAVSFTYRDADGRALLADGTPIEAALAAAARDGAAVVGVNCVEPDAVLAEVTAAARAVVAVPFAAKPSPGLPGAVRPPAAFAAALRPAVAAGAALVGGCCGAGAPHLRALRAALAEAA